MSDPVPLLSVDTPRGYRTLHRLLVAALTAGLGAAVAIHLLVPHRPDPGIDLIAPAGLVVAATFLFTAWLVSGPYRRGLLYKIAKGTWPPGGETDPDAARLARAFAVRASVPWGLVVATGIFDAVCYAVQGRWPNLAVAAGTVVLLVVLAPTKRRCERFVRAGVAALPGLRAGP